jgi:hypothetical protein
MADKKVADSKRLRAVAIGQGREGREGRGFTSPSFTRDAF